MRTGPRGALRIFFSSRSQSETAMLKTLPQARLHRVRVTGADLDDEGSCGFDELLLEAAGEEPVFTAVSTQGEQRFGAEIGTQSSVHGVLPTSLRWRIGRS